MVATDHIFRSRQQAMSPEVRESSSKSGSGINNPLFTCMPYFSDVVTGQWIMLDDKS